MQLTDRFLNTRLAENHIINTILLSQLSLLTCVVILFSSTVSTTMKLDLREPLLWLMS